MAISTITAVLPWDVHSVWNTVTSVRDYTWRSDLERTESLNERQFVEYTKNAKPLKEIDTDFMLKTLDHIKVFEDATLLVVFLDGSEIECRSEEA